MSIGWDNTFSSGAAPAAEKFVGPFSQRLGRPFFDLDDLIEDAEGMSVLRSAVSCEAFSKAGRRILLGSCSDTPSVVALGGGAP